MSAKSAQPDSNSMQAAGADHGGDHRDVGASLERCVMPARQVFSIAVVILLCFLGTELSPPLWEQPVFVLACYLCGGAAWALLASRVIEARRLRVATAESLGAMEMGDGATRGLNSRKFSVVSIPWAVLLTLIILLRLIAVSGEPELSDDLHRYVWEGAVGLEGGNAYLAGPDDPAWSELALRYPLTHASINHRELPAAYPPFTQFACMLGVALGTQWLPGSTQAVVSEEELGQGEAVGEGLEQSPVANGANDASVKPVAPSARSAMEKAAALGVRWVFLLCDLAILLPLAYLARRRFEIAPKEACALWGFCPLAALEFSDSGHFDSLGILFLVLGLAGIAATVAAAKAAANSRALLAAALSGGALAAAVLTKFLPLAVLPFAARDLWRSAERGRKLTFTFLAAGTLSGILILAPHQFGLFEPAGFGSGGLSSYAFRWESTNLIYSFLEQPLTLLLASDESWSDPRRVGRALIGLFWLLGLIFAWRRGFDAWSAGGLALGLFLLLTPTLHPWYLLWMLPWVAMRPSAAWVWLIAVAPLLYAPVIRYRRVGEWVEPDWVWPLVAFPFLLLLLRSLFAKKSLA